MNEESGFCPMHGEKQGDSIAPGTVCNGKSPGCHRSSGKITDSATGYITDAEGKRVKPPEIIDVKIPEWWPFKQDTINITGIELARAMNQVVIMGNKPGNQIRFLCQITHFLCLGPMLRSVLNEKEQAAVDALSRILLANITKQDKSVIIKPGGN